MENEMNHFISNSSRICEAGLVRKTNEDAILYLPEAGVFIVSDGMGGAPGGEMASRMVVDRLISELRDFSCGSPGERKYHFQQALHKINSEIILYAEKHRFKAMGATIVAFLLNPWNPENADVCHIGDSRCYCFRKGELFRLTEDHSLSDTKEKRHVLTNSLGGAAYMAASWNSVSVCPADRFILCSDGLTSVVPDERIQEILKGGHDVMENIEDLQEDIVRRGAPDNYSIICIEIPKQLPLPPTLAESDWQESNLLYNIAERRKDYGRK